jgi:hypothetical protein
MRRSGLTSVLTSPVSTRVAACGTAYPHSGLPAGSHGSILCAPLSRAHGLFNVVTGLWPVVHMRSFEAVSGPKVDRWLVRTVGGLMAANGVAQLTAGDAEQRLSARIGLGTSAVLATVDVWYGATGRISRIYLLDAVVQLGWMAAWTAALRRAKTRA